MIAAAAVPSAELGGRRAAPLWPRLIGAAETLSVPLIAIAATLVLFGVFVAIAGVDPLELYSLMYTGAFGTWFSWQNTLQRAAPLMLTTLCTAIPAWLGLIIIGGEGALVLGGLAAAATGLALGAAAPALTLIVMACAAVIVGGVWIAIAGALRQFRGVNETIASLLLTYIAIALFNHVVEGPLRDPASLNKPSTAPLPASLMLGNIPGMDVHWGLAVGVIACLIAFVAMRYTVFGFSARVTGGNVRAARMVGLPVGRLIMIACFLGGGAAGLAGMLEVAAVHGRANASLAAGYGYSGVLIAFLARHNPLAALPVAILLGGIAASGGLLQRRLDLPDATVLVLQGILFIAILASETLYGRIKFGRGR